ncbi:MAG: subclass B1 metallo-beta-lactamase [Prolixibacteraceae bacterium]
MKTTFLLLCIFILTVTRALAQDKTDRIDRNIGLTKLAEQVFLIQTSYACNGNLDCNHLLILDQNEVVLVNTPARDSMTVVLLQAIKKKFGKKVTRVLVSHFHDDSSGGLNETARRGIISYSLDKTRDLLLPEHKSIDVVFSDSLSVQLPTTRLNLFFLGAGHSVDNSLVWLPEEKILFGGCLLKSLQARAIGNIQDADLQAWPETVQKVKTKFFGAKIVIPGHLVVGDTSIFSHTIKILETQ